MQITFSGPVKWDKLKTKAEKQQASQQKHEQKNILRAQKDFWKTADVPTLLKEEQRMFREYNPKRLTLRQIWHWQMLDHALGKAFARTRGVALTQVDQWINAVDDFPDFRVPRALMRGMRKARENAFRQMPPDLPESISLSENDMSDLN